MNWLQNAKVLTKEEKNQWARETEKQNVEKSFADHMVNEDQESKGKRKSNIYYSLLTSAIIFCSVKVWLAKTSIIKALFMSVVIGLLVPV